MDKKRFFMHYIASKKSDVVVEGLHIEVNKLLPYSGGGSKPESNQSTSYPTFACYIKFDTPLPEGNYTINFVSYSNVLFSVTKYLTSTKVRLNGWGYNGDTKISTQIYASTEQVELSGTYKLMTGKSLDNATGGFYNVRQETYANRYIDYIEIIPA